MRLIPPVRPYSNRFLKGFICMLIYVACWPLLAYLAGKLIPAIGSGDISKVSSIIVKSLLLFLIQKTAQFGQDVFIAKPSLEISEVMRGNLFNFLPLLVSITPLTLTDPDLIKIFASPPEETKFFHFKN